MISALFDLPKKPRKPRQWRMRVADAGYRCIQFKCPRCGYDTGWIIDDRTVSQNKRGLPCPTCNNLDRVKRGTAPGNPWAEGVPGSLRVASGPATGLDRNRRRRIEAIGDSNPPIMYEVIARSVLAAHSSESLKSEATRSDERVAEHANSCLTHNISSGDRS